MNVASVFRSHARKTWRALWPILVVVGGAVTCDSPTVPRPAIIAITPKMDFAGLREFAGLAVTDARITILRPPSETLVTRTVPFLPDADHLDVAIDVQITGSETLNVIFELLAGSQVVFTGSQTVDVTAGVSTPQTTTVTPLYVGPGSQLAAIHIAPGDSGAAYGGQVQFRLTGTDSSNNPVGTFYAHWRTGSTVHTINATGMFSAGSARGVVWVYAVTPTGIKDSTRITVAPVPSAVQIVSGNGQSAATGTALPQPLVAKVIAQDNGPVVGIPVTFAAATGGGSVSPPVVLTDINGLAQTTATLGTSAGSNTYTASVTGLSPATFSGTGTGPALPTLVFTVQPTTATAGTAIAPSVQVAAKDGSGNVVTTFTGNVLITIGTNPGSGTLAGTVSAPAVSGVATFGNLSIDKSGTGYTLAANAVGATSGTSSSFNINAGAATALVLVSGNNQAGAALTPLAQPVVVKAADAFGNGVSGKSVTFAVTAGGGSVGTPAPTTGANGTASTTWTLGASGTQSLSATSAGLTGSPLTVNATIQAPIASTTVTPHRDTITAIGATFTLAAQAKDALGNLLTGSFTWVSRNPAVATVNASGVVTAVTNDSTYVVAIEAGGTKDSSRIVVQQRIATINVTPGGRNIYLTRNFTFGATAVDGTGHALPVQPTFTWSSTVPAVASVNTAGLVQALSLGSTQIRAASGAVIGVSNVNVVTPITRIAVVVDTVGAFKTDTFALASLGIKRHYRAIAHDTLDAVMSGLTFTWASTNGSVAQISQASGDTTTATAAANGGTRIQATAQGFTSAPGALLVVSQVLSSIVLSPPASNPTATVAVNGNMNVVARGKDANGFFMPAAAIAFGYVSDNLPVATVIAATGMVTGVANGTANITASASSITSNNLVVTVGGGAVPSIISFGRDTVSVGRGGTASIPILLSKPNGANLTVNLAVQDTFAFWSTTSVTIPAGQTSINATLNGRNAGTTVVSATDGSGAGYTAASAVAKVTANMHLQASSYAINGTDVVTTQVQLSDPSPAGGTFVTFSYGTQNIAQVSPDPAFIPAGQLAADIQILGVGTGSTTITPIATGVNGTASTFQVFAPVLSPSQSSMRLGAGQFDQNLYIQAPTYNNLAVPVTVTSTDTNLVSVPTTVTIPAGNYYTYLSVTGKAPGLATVSFASPGWTNPTTVAVRVTTPHVGICCNASLVTTSGQQLLTVYSEDSTKSIHYRTNSLSVRLSSTDTTVIKVLDTLVTIPPGNYYNSSARYVMGGSPGTARIIATASGHTPDSTSYTVTGPSLAFSSALNRVGTGQEDYSAVYVYTPANVTSPLQVTLTSSDSSIVGVTSLVTVVSNNNYVYVPLIRGKAVGQVTLTATAAGYAPATMTYRVTSPRVVVSSCCSLSLNNFGPGTNLTLYAADSLRSQHYRSSKLVVSLTSTDPSVVTVDSASVAIDSGVYYNNHAHLTPVGPGTAKIILVAAGHGVDTLTVTVNTPALFISFVGAVVGLRQHSASDGVSAYSIQTPDYRSSPLPVTITQLHGSVDSLSSTALTIPTNSYYTYFDAFGKTLGRDTIIVTAAGYRPDTAFIVVSTPRFSNCCMPAGATTTSPPLGINVYATDSLGSIHYVSDTVVVAGVSSDSTVIKPVLPFFRILKGSYYSTQIVNIVGPGVANVTWSDSAGSGYLPTVSPNITVTGPSLRFSNGTTMLGMRQTDGSGSSYVYVPNNVTSPLVVSLISTDTRVATVPATITIPVNSYYAYFPVTARDTLGTVQIQATATGYQAASFNVQVTVPKLLVDASTPLNTTSPPGYIYVYPADANNNIHYTAEDVQVTLTSSNPSVAGIDSATVTIVAGNQYNGNATWAPGTPGTSQITASDPRSALYKYTTGTQPVTVQLPMLNLYQAANSLGIGQYEDYFEVDLADYAAATTTVNLGHGTTARTAIYDNQTTTPITSVTIPQSGYYGYFRVAGVSSGTDTLVASVTSPLHRPDSVYVEVGQGRVDPISGWPGSIKAGDSVAVTIYARDPNTGIHPVLNATTFTLAPNANIEFRKGGAVITTIIIPAGQEFVSFYVKGLAAGTGSATITATNYQTYPTSLTVTP